MDPSYSNKLDERKRVFVFDTTLRDGEQSPGCTLYQDEKIRLAVELERLGVDVIEAGFAASRQTDRETIQKICRKVNRLYIGSLSRCVKGDIDAAYEAMKEYPKRRIHVFMPTSKIQVYDKMGKNYEVIKKNIFESVDYARNFFENMEFSCEDATRTEPSLLDEIYSRVVELGVNTVNIPDTVGASYPEDFGKLVRRINENIKGINPEAKVSIHCHNDLGFATVNSIYGILNGAEQVECTINGIGERAGNCALEQIVAHERFSNKFQTKINSANIGKVSRILKEMTGVRNDFAPISGAHAFSHKAGIHQHGEAKAKGCYEIFTPEEFGRESKLIIGPHSGVHGVIAHAKKMSFEITKDHAERVLQRVSELVRKREKKDFSDEDIARFINETK
jgi:2-isopropylmalate synthase